MSAPEFISESSLDPRVRRTRQLLHQAFFALLKEKSFETVTVQDITERATVNRATFYDHFSDKFALFDDIIAEGFQAVLKTRFQNDTGFCPHTLLLLIETVCDYLSQLPTACGNSDSHKLLELLTEAKVKAMVRMSLVKWLGATGKYRVQDDLELAATMTSSSIYAACFSWSKNRNGLTSDQYAQTILPWVKTNLPLQE